MRTTCTVSLLFATLFFLCFHRSFSALPDPFNGGVGPSVSGRRPVRIRTTDTFIYSGQDFDAEEGDMKQTVPLQPSIKPSPDAISYFTRNSKSKALVSVIAGFLSYVYYMVLFYIYRVICLCIQLFVWPY